MKLLALSTMALGLGLGLAACATNQPPAPLGPPVPEVVFPADALTSPQIHDSIVGNTGTGTMSGSHITYSMYVGPDGTALANLPTGIDHGAWHLTDDGQWCVKWDLYRGGQEYCQRVYRTGNTFKFVNTDSIEILNFQPGKHV